MAGAAVLALAVGAPVSAAAEEEQTTTISGTVSRQDDGTPLENVSVYVTSADFTQGGVAVTGTDGGYAVPGLQPGEYTVRFTTDTSGAGFITEYWDDARSWDRAQRITVLGGEEISGIDASLERGGSISGRVTRESDDAPVAGVHVQLSPDSFLVSPAMAITAADGTYQAVGLPAATYTVKFDAPDESLSDEYWEEALTPTAATGVRVDAGSESSGIDASLVGASAISGTVTTADGSPVFGTVSASGGGNYFSSPIAPDGSYRLAVAPGAYEVQFTSYDSRVLSEYWENSATSAEATPVTIASGQSLTLSAELDRAVAIIGTVLADGLPLADAVVEIWQDGLLGQGMAYTDSSGHYEVMLRPGTYTVSAYGSAYEPVYAKQFYDRADTRSEATDVTVGESADATGVDFDLSLGGDIGGTITADGSEVPGSGADVVAYLWSGGEWREVARAATGSDYRFGTGLPEQAEGGPLPAGAYRIGVFADGFCAQYYGGSSSIEGAQSVELAEGDVLAGIDVALDATCTEPEPEPAPELTLAVDSVRAGGDLLISGRGFVAGETVAFELHSDPLALGTLTADADGRISGTLRIPTSAPAGAHTLVALGAGATVQASVPLRVTAAAVISAPAVIGEATTAPRGLADTGAEAPGMAALTGAFLAVVGAAMIRRRRAHS